MRSQAATIGHDALMDAVAVVVGTMVVTWVLASAIRTVVIPRPERVTLGWGLFAAARLIARAVADRISNPARRERVLGTFPAVTLAAYPAVWSLGVVFGFALVFWGFDVEPFSSAMVLSASSLTTLGFATASGDGLRLVAAVEAFLGLGIVALMISFLPTIYGTFSQREIAAGRLTIRAGEPPLPADYILRSHRIDTMGQLEDRWFAWEEWFVELGETHTTFPQLIYFRSHRPGRTWIGAAEAALDTAALVTACRLTPSSGGAETMIRAGFLALGNIADFLRIERDIDPGPQTPVSVTRQQFDALVDELEAGGVELTCARDEAWQHYRGWRVNYDQAVAGLLDQVGYVESHWQRYD